MTDVKLKVCDINLCEAMCCYDGAYLKPGEEEFIKDLVERLPELKTTLPEEFIVDGFWEGEYLGRKTATRPVTYTNPDFPEHFTRTRCVFSDDKGFCELEKLGRNRGEHPWKFKPATCWVFPLNVIEGQPAAPPLSPENDPYRSESYPGFITTVPCGRHNPEGNDWMDTLKREIIYLKEVKTLPVLGSPGNKVEDLLK